MLALKLIGSQLSVIGMTSWLSSTVASLEGQPHCVSTTNNIVNRVVFYFLPSDTIAVGKGQPLSLKPTRNKEKRKKKRKVSVKLHRLKGAQGSEKAHHEKPDRIREP